MHYIYNTRVSQFELNYWNKWTFPRHSNLLRCTCIACTRGAQSCSWRSTVLQSSDPTLIKHTLNNLQAILKTLISCFRCVWLELELNFAGQSIARSRIGHPWPTLLKIKVLNWFWWFLEEPFNIHEIFSSYKRLFIVENGTLDALHSEKNCKVFWGSQNDSSMASLDKSHFVTFIFNLIFKI